MNLKSEEKTEWNVFLDFYFICISMPATKELSNEQWLIERTILATAETLMKCLINLSKSSRK